MCSISAETIIRANKKTVDNTVHHTDVSSNGIVISTKYNDREYSQVVSFGQIKENYGKALKEYSQYGKVL